MGSALMQNTSAEEFKLDSRFQSLRRTLSLDRYTDRIDRPLVFWTLHSDRRLPLAFLPCSIRSLLETPFEELVATPGVGQKKIATLLGLLARAAKEPPPPDGDGDPESLGGKSTNGRHKTEGDKFDPSTVSESSWERWRDTVCSHHLGYEKLGRLAPTLQSLATVMWHRPLSDYCDVTIVDMRKMRTHGEKRVRAILEIFHAVHEAIECLSVDNHLAIRMVPKFVPPLEQWLANRVSHTSPPTLQATRQEFVAPLLAQLRLDCGPGIAKLADGRLGISAAPQTVRNQAKKLGVTRARVYQMLEECAKVMRVRWPDGGPQLAELVAKGIPRAQAGESLPLLRETYELFFSDEQAWARRAQRDSEA